MTPLLVDFASPVSFRFTGSGLVADRVPAVRLPIPDRCVCADGSCRRCYLDDDVAFQESQDV